jgi:quercetin dioxygenase-like cupin family protein
MRTIPHFVVRGASLKPSPTRRRGVRERRLLTYEHSSHQNLILIDMEPGAEVELHEVKTSESILVLQGTFEVILPTATETLEPGDLCYFPPRTSHAMRCTGGPGQFLVVFAPSRYAIDLGD